MAHATRVSKTDLRRDVRFATEFNATLRADGLPRGVIVGDISAHGALIKGRFLPMVGAKIQLIARSLIIGGRVMWRNDGLAGVSFERTVNPLQIERENSDYFDGFRKRRAVRPVSPVFVS